MNDRHILQPSPVAQKWMKVFTHLLCLGIIFILPEVIVSKSIPDGMVHWRGYVKSAIFVGVFYLNYYYVIDRCLGKSRWALRLIGWNMAVILINMTLVYILFFHASAEVPLNVRQTPHEVMMHRLSFIVRDGVMVLLTAALSVAMKLSDYWMSLNNRSKELTAMQQREELESLKKQLNPHFLFNTLNTIYALISIDPEKACAAIHELSRMLRYVLYENTPTVRLKDEIEFVDNYIKLMRLRLGDSMAVNVMLNVGDCGESRIAPLLFISPVENAFKYGNTGRPGDDISVSITCHDGIVDCVIINHFLPVDGDSHCGIGIVNLRRRLELIYGNNAEMCTDIAGDVYTFKLRIKL